MSNIDKDYRQFGISIDDDNDVDLWQDNPQSDHGKDHIFLLNDQVDFFIRSLKDSLGIEKSPQGKKYIAKCESEGYRFDIIVDSITEAVDLKEEFNRIVGIQIEVTGVEEY